MSQPIILCVDDQRDVLAALVKDLAPFAPHCDLIECESADEAWQEAEEIDATGGQLAIVISDQVMPGGNGTDLLARLNNDGRFQHTRKMLLTGLATHDDTIDAINRARVESYIAKPWEVERLQATVAELLTRWVIAAGVDYQPMLEVLDKPVLFELLRHRT